MDWAMVWDTDLAMGVVTDTEESAVGTTLDTAMGPVALRSIPVDSADTTTAAAGMDMPAPSTRLIATVELVSR